jgi:putative peptidoglycan lipid II flippase
MPGWLVGRVTKQLIAAVAMGGALYAVKIAIGDMVYGGAIEKILGVGALVGTGALVYFAIAWAIGGIDRDAILILLRRKPPTSANKVTD